MNELDRAIRKHTRAQEAEREALKELHAAIRAEMNARAGERGAQADIVKRTGYTRERIRQLMKDE